MIKRAFAILLPFVALVVAAATYNAPLFFTTVSELTNSVPLTKGLVAGVVLNGTNRLYWYNSTSTAAISGYEILPSINSTGRWVSYQPAAGAGSGTVTSVDGSGGSSGLTLTGGPITGTGTLTIGGTLDLDNGGTGATNAANARTALGLGTASTNAASAFAAASHAHIISDVTSLQSELDLRQRTNANLTTIAGLSGGTSTNFFAGDGTFKQVTTNMVPGLPADIANLVPLAGATMTGALSNSVSIGSPVLMVGSTNVAAALASAGSGSATNVWIPLPTAGGGWHLGGTQTNLFPTANTTNGIPVRVWDPDTEWTLRNTFTIPPTLPSTPTYISFLSEWRPVAGNSASQNIVVGLASMQAGDADAFGSEVLVTNTVSSQTWINFTNTVPITNFLRGSSVTIKVAAKTTGTATNNYQSILKGVTVW